jgi:hypothetical protein
MAVVIVWAATFYVWIGMAVALLFVAFGLDRVDPAARGAYAFRPLLLPGATLLWPYVIRRWARVGFF